ncbi:MAG: hypothetical protein JJT89_18465 [Nitriliruptoraceae bacterium]|nr:hypothetical protein [Nitriliruptoraceae bacterium]
MQFEELRFVCQEAASDLLRTRGRPLPPTIVLPGPERTQLLTLPDLPGDDEARHAVIAQLALDRVTTDRVPCWGFVAEAEVGDEDVVLVVYGARRHAPELTASPFAQDGDLAGFVPAEQLDPTALPFLHPLQHAVDALPAAGDVFGDIDPKRGEGGLPIIG